MSFPVNACPKCGTHLMVSKAGRPKRSVYCPNPDCSVSFPVPNKGRIQTAGKLCKKCYTPVARLMEGGHPRITREFCLNSQCSYQSNVQKQEVPQTKVHYDRGASMRHADEILKNDRYFCVSMNPKTSAGENIAEHLQRIVDKQLYQRLAEKNCRHSEEPIIIFRNDADKKRWDENNRKLSEDMARYRMWDENNQRLSEEIAKKRNKEKLRHSKQEREISRWEELTHLPDFPEPGSYDNSKDWE